MITARLNRFLAFSSQSRMLVTVLAVMSVTHLGAAARVRAADCNHNGTEDAIDIAAETSLDCNNDGIPDECQSVVVDEDFDSYSPDDDPANWFSTDTESSTDELTTSFGFRVRQVGSDLTLGTNYPHPNIHSHYVEPGATNISSMTYTGRMRISSSDCGIGVTFLSQFSDQPTSTYEYVRIRRANYAPSAQTFHLAPPNFDNFVGVKDSGVNPSVNTWYRFRVVVDTGGSQLHVQANIWEDGQPEPAGFQIDAIDSSGQHPTSGTIGVWSMGVGGKFWDDLEVVLPSNQVPCDDGDPCTTCDSTDGGPCEGIPVDCSHLDSDCGTGVCNANTGDCEVVPANEGGACNDSDACTTDDVCLAGVCTGLPIDCSQLDDTCNTGACNPSTGSCEAIAINEGGGCDDLNACTLNDECVGGVCTGDSVDCSHLDDGCTIGVCNESNGECETDSAEDGGSCDDLNPCTEGDTCTDGVCDGTPLDCSHLSSSCLPGVCNPETGLCEGPPQTDCNMNGISDDCELLSSPSYAKLTAPDGVSDDRFGAQVALQGTTAIVSAYFGSVSGVSESGSAYVIQNVGMPSEYFTELTYDDPTSGDYFGYSASLSGDTLVVGANRDDDDGIDSGSAYVFTLSNGAWQQVTKLTADDAAGDDLFGSSVAIDGDFIVIGAYGDDSGGSSSGAAYAFEKINGAWSQIDKLTANDASSDDLFGRSLAISGDTVVIGAYQAEEAGKGETGAVYVFRRIGGMWQQITKLTANDAVSGDGFGVDVAIDGDTIVVGAFRDHEGAADSGAAFVFREIGGVWQQVAKLTSGNPVENANFGRGVDIEGHRIVVGAYRDNANGFESGTIYLWEESGGAWQGPVEYTPTETAAGDRFGFAIALSGNRSIVGAFLDDDKGTDSGSAFLVTFAAEDCNSNAILDECDIASGVVTDCNLNGIPDICEPFGENSQDCSHLDDACVTGICNLEAGTCEVVSANEGGICDDEDLCTIDSCVAGVCTGIPLDCSDLDGCSAEATCNPETGMCEAPVETDCNANTIPDDCELIEITQAASMGPVGGDGFTTGSQSGKSIAFRPSSGDSAYYPPYPRSGIMIMGDPAAETIVYDADCESEYWDPDCEHTYRTGAFQAWQLFDGEWDYLEVYAGDEVDGAQLGQSVAFDGNTALVSAPGQSLVHVYEGYDWLTRVTTLPIYTGGGLGNNVSVSGTTALLGAPSGGSSQSGYAHIYERVNGTWQFAQGISAEVQRLHERFGSSAAIDGDIAIVGASGANDNTTVQGAVYVFERTDSTWQQTARIVPEPSYGGNYFGCSVAIDRETAVVGSYGDDFYGQNSGAAYIIEKVAGNWQIVASLFADDAAAGDAFGSSVSIDGQHVVIGSKYNDEKGISSGASYVFRGHDGNWVQIAKLTAAETNSGDHFGTSLDIYRGTLVVGADNAGNGGYTPGGAHGFDLVDSDCNGNGVPDDCDISAGTSPDCNLNGTPDECEPFGNNSFDCSHLDSDCVLGVCNLETGLCETTAANDGSACDDLNPCTEDDVCASGECMGTIRDCSEYDIECLSATCDPGTGLCEPPEVVNDCNANDIPDECEVALGFGYSKFVTPDGGTNDLYGFSIDVDGRVAIIGAPDASPAGTAKAGSVYVLENVDGVWQHLQHLTANDGTTDDRFGYSVSLDGDAMVVGANRDDENGWASGSAYVLMSTNGMWQQIAKLTPNDPASVDFFGTSVAIRGDTILIGAHYDKDHGNYSGSVYVFRRVGGIWQQIVKLNANDASSGQYFGRSLAISGSTAVIGAYGASKTGVSNCGAAYVFREVGGVWQQIAKLTADDAAQGDEFGLDVAIDGSNIVVGANRDDDGATDSGSGYVFREIGGVWQQVAKVNAGDYSEGARFGFSVEIHGDRAIFGAVGDSQNGTESGAAYVSRIVGGYWQPPVKFTPIYAEANDRLGISVAINQDLAFAGAYFDDDKGPESGSMYLFTYESSDCNNNGIPDECDIAEGTSSDCNTNGIPDSCEYAPIIASPSASECPGTMVTLDAGSGYESYLWEPGGETTQTIQVTSPGTYRVMASGGAGTCSASDAISVAFNGNQPGTTAALVSSKLTNSVVAIDTQSGDVLFDFAPSGKDGLSDPNGITVDDVGHVYVSSVNTSSVKKFAAFTGELIREYTGSLTAPVGVLVADSNTLLVANWSDDSVHKFDIVTGQALGQLVASGAGGLDGPADMLITPSGKLLVSSQKGDQVLAYDAASGAFSHVAAQGGGLLDPAGLRLDSQGNLLVASFNSDQVLRFNPETGAFIDVFIGDNPGSPGTDESGGLDGPEGIEWGANGNLLVNNRYGSNVLEYDGTTGAFLRVLGAEGLSQPTYLTMTTLDPDCNADRIPDYCASDTGLAGMDCNFNGIGDQCDDASHGDFDANGVLDIIDFGYLADCQAGPDVAPSPASGSCANMCLQAFDADEDGDIDLHDFASFTLAQ